MTVQSNVSPFYQAQWISLWHNCNVTIFIQDNTNINHFVFRLDILCISMSLFFLSWRLSIGHKWHLYDLMQNSHVLTVVLHGNLRLYLRTNVIWTMFSMIGPVSTFKRICHIPVHFLPYNLVFKNERCMLIQFGTTSSVRPFSVPVLYQSRLTLSLITWL